MIDEQLAYKSAAELRDFVATKQVSPVELAELFFERIGRLDPQLNSFLLVTRDLAMKQAKAAEDAVMRGDELGPLHGLPIPFKDTQMTAGVRTTMASVVHHDRIPEKNAAVVERMLEAGAVMLGKTNASEFGIVGASVNSLGVTGRNPWDTDRTPGGSSGGAAAAVAAYLCPIATGSDGGGSLRIPANFCGIYAIKPTLGRVSMYTAVDGPHKPNTFSQPGPLARTVRDAAMLLQAMAGFDRRDSGSLRQTPPDFIAATEKDIEGLRIGWTPDFGFADVFPEVADVTYKAALAFEELGCAVEEVKMVLPEPYDSFGPIQSAGAYNDLAQHLGEFGARMMEYTKFSIEKGSKVTTSDYMRAEGRIADLKATFDDVFETCDLIISPVSRFPAFLNDDPFPGSITGGSSYPEQFWNGAFTMHANAIGHPAASIPAGFSSDDLPIGLQIIGRRYDEETVLAASAVFEQARPWIQHRPPVS
jgi:Asp-tRNA(Asn)/Glu-tRNA(Gln) amidotransferase A subunit family amidase